MFYLTSLFLVGASAALTASTADPNCSADASNGTWTELSCGKIQPTKELKWVDRYPGTQCARLEVPLDYHNPEDGQTAAIALLRIPANVSTGGPDYRGPILFNPGGPGESGVDLILSLGTAFQRNIGSQFDMVGFDPRGIQRSTPKISFYDSAMERAIGFPAADELNHSTDDTVASFWARTKNIGSLAITKQKDVLPHMNTEFSARDMLSIVQAHGQEKLQFWGMSYGTVLGSTFAAMFPDKIERMIIDGVVDVEADYYTAKWLTLTKDTDKTLNWFFRTCLEAGPQVCAFHESSIEAMESKLNSIYTSLIKAPVPIFMNSTSMMIDYGRLRDGLFFVLYHPLDHWYLMAQLLQALATGDVDKIPALFGPGGLPFTEGSTAGCECETNTAFDKLPEAIMGYVCNDGDAVPPEFEEAERHWKEITDLTSWGSVMAPRYIACNGWSKDIPKAQFRGPITGNTSFPLLFIGNTADPATPVSAAAKVSKLFPKSVLLTQDSPGHGSINAPSECTRLAIRAYFNNGTLPAEGTVCPMDPVNPFTFGLELAGNATAKREVASGGVTEMLDAMRHYNKKGRRSLLSV